MTQFHLTADWWVSLAAQVSYFSALVTVALICSVFGNRNMRQTERWTVRKDAMWLIYFSQLIVTKKLVQLRPFYGSLGFVRDKPVSLYQKKHSPTDTYHGHQQSLICFLHLLRFMHPPCSIHAPDSLFAQSLSKFSLVYLLIWHCSLHTPCISSSNHCLLFTAHAHTITTCFAAVPRLCHLILVSLNPLLGTQSFNLMPHIHLTILISACWIATSFSFLKGQVSLPCIILLCSQLLYNLPLTIHPYW